MSGYLGRIALEEFQEAKMVARVLRKVTTLRVLPA
jgi:hypothetical protein